MIEIRVLGPLEIDIDGVLQPLPKLAAARDLIAYLSLARTSRPRDDLYAVLWPEDWETALEGDDFDLRHRLAGRLDRAVSTANKALRGAAGGRDSWIVRDERAHLDSGGSVRLLRGEHLEIDNDASRAVLEGAGASDLLDALRRHRGPVLDGIDRPWIEEYRTRQRNQLKRALGRIGYENSDDSVAELLAIGADAFLAARAAESKDALAGTAETVRHLRSAFDDLSRYGRQPSAYLKLSEEEQSKLVEQWLGRRERLSHALAAVRTKVSVLLREDLDSAQRDAVLRLRVATEREAPLLSETRISTPFSPAPEIAWDELDTLAHEVDSPSKRNP